MLILNVMLVGVLILSLMLLLWKLFMLWVWCDCMVLLNYCFGVK